MSAPYLLVAALAVATAATLAAKTQNPPRRPTVAQSQTAAAANAMNHALIVLDPAHGGPDAGGRLGDRLVEKDFTLAFAMRLRAALQTAGFTVITLRDSDPTAAFPTDQRAEIANRSHALACLVLHATAVGSGVHVYASALHPADTPDAAATTGSSRAYEAFEPVPWDRAQAGSVRQSLQLEKDVAAAIGVTNLPLIAGRTSVRPLDNLICPAIAVEIAPLVADGQDTVPVTDAGYQQHIANALARGLLTWRGRTDPSVPARAMPLTPPRPLPLPGPGAGASQ